MMEKTQNTVISTEALSKRYGQGALAVNHLTMTVQRGEVYGFVGPNGSGKTTTLRMMLGLVRPSDGSCEVLGSRPGRPDTLGRIGALVETPSFYPFISGRDNLRVMARHAGLDYSRIDAALDTVGLLGRANDRFRSYSLGMKQRLGMAAALLKEPELLILDEPTNGLDPAGMAEMRELIRHLGRGHRTVLLSSHLMGELEQICDRIGVIKGGSLVAEGTLDELLAGEKLRIRATPPERAMELLGSRPDVGRIETEPDNILMVEADSLDPAEVNSYLVANGIKVSELCRVKPSLENIFLKITGDEHAAGETESERTAGGLLINE